MINRATRTSPSVLREYPGAMQHAAVSSIVRSCIAIARGKLYTAERPAAYVKSRWPGDRTTDLVMRAATAPASPGAAGWAQELAQITTQFLASLVPVSAGANLLARGVQLNLDGAGLISMPLISQSAATFVRAGGSIPVRQFTTSAVGLEPRGLKLAATLTAEMLASSSAEDAARAVLIESAALGVDAALFSASAATPDAPAGLLNGIAATAPSSATLGRTPWSRTSPSSRASSRARPATRSCW
jgi:hypothetical protein